MKSVISLKKKRKSLRKFNIKNKSHRRNLVGFVFYEGRKSQDKRASLKIIKLTHIEKDQSVINYKY